MRWTVQAAYGVDSDAFKAEMMGSAISRNHNFISPEHISLLRDDDQSLVYTEDMLRTPPHYVFVSIDPSGSTRSKVDGETSDYAFVTAFVHKGSFVVCFISLQFPSLRRPPRSLRGRQWVRQPATTSWQHVPRACLHP